MTMPKGPKNEETGECTAGLMKVVDGRYEPATELACDAMDNDCDGTADEGLHPLQRIVKDNQKALDRINRSVRGRATTHDYSSFADQEAPSVEEKKE